jgi:heme transport system ATP-binding protein
VGVIGLARHVAPPPAARRGEAALVAAGVLARRGPRLVLDGADLTLRYGELLALVGPNGAGKTTLLHLLAGDEPPAGGTVRLGARPASAWPPRAAALRRGVLPQRAALAFPFLVEDVVAMGRAPWLATGPDADGAARVEWAMRTAGVEELRGRRFPSLSGGEAARVSLARLLAQDAPILLLDEPTAAMDPHHQEHTFTVLLERARDGDAVLAVLHDLNLAATYADRVALLSRGRVVTGPPEEVLTDRSLTEAYGHPMEVVRHPRTGAPVVLPRR